ncbi:MAG: hypothetical protein J5883_07455, partial [Clostridiales bacterium]|nr:hypothetical protein [Clostridiales bacterium]
MKGHSESKLFTYHELDVFTDRESICNDEGLFWKTLDGLQKGGHAIINIHGIAGIGKTTVTTFLMNRLTEKGYSDFFSYKMGQYGRGIEKDKERFLIEFAYYLMKKEKRIDLSGYLYAYGKIIDPLSPEKAVISELRSIDERCQEAVNFGADMILQYLPIAGDILKKAIELTIKNYKTTPPKRIKADLDRASVDEIRRKLFEIFAKDAKAHFEKRDTPFIIFVDDFEKFALPGGGSEIENDKRWFKKLTVEFPNTLWVITGRDRVGWDDYYDEDDLPEQVLLEGFDDKRYVREYFDKYSEKSGSPKISDEIVDHVWNLTKGIPFYLKLCLDEYDSCADKEHIDKDEFGKDAEELWRRFYNNYTDEQKDVMAFLCTLPNNWSLARAYKIYSMVDEEYREKLAVFEDTLKDLIGTSAFTIENGVIRIHEVIRTAVLQHAEKLGNLNRLLEFLNAQKEMAGEYRKWGFWEREYRYRKNICDVLEIWGETHDGWRPLLAGALEECGDCLLYNEFYNSSDVEERAGIALESYKKAVALFDDIADWKRLELFIYIVDAKIIANGFDNVEDEILSITSECLDIVRKQHSDDWKGSVKYLYRLWNKAFEKDFSIVEYIVELLEKHPDTKDGEIMEIASSLLDWDESIEEDPGFMEEEAESINMDAESISSEILEEYEDFLKELKTRTEPYSEEDYLRVLSLINKLIWDFRCNEAVDLADGFFEIYKRQNGDKDNKNSLDLIRAKIECYEIFDYLDGLESAWQKICDIQAGDDYDDDISGLGND